jgi:hypothetical protein
MWTSQFKKFLDMIFGRLSLSLEVAFDSCYELVAGVVVFLIAVPITGHHGNVTGPALLSLLPTLSAFVGGWVGAARPCNTHFFARIKILCK